MEIKSNVSNLTNVKDADAQYLINNVTTCNRKFMLFKYGFLDELWMPEDVKNIIIHKHILLEVQLQKFLRLVVKGEQDQAEAMLKDNPDLGLLAGDVTDLSKRSFNNITGLQYAVWALDYHMWTMLLKYLKPEAITKQLQDMETGSWVKAHGKSASWHNLIDALDTYLSICKQSKWTEASKQWNRGVGDAQALLPVHVVNEYCHPNRSFDPCPNFKDATPLPRSRKTDEGEWFTAEYNGGVLGTGKFAVCRGTAWRPLWCARLPAYARDEADRTAVATLLGNRLEQCQALFAEYIGNKSQVQFKLK